MHLVELSKQEGIVQVAKVVWGVLRVAWAWRVEGCRCGYDCVGVGVLVCVCVFMRVCV